MKVYIIKKIDCGLDAASCDEKLRQKIKDKFGSFWNETENKSSGHMSIRHTPNHHEIYIYFYDKNGIFEDTLHNEKRTLKADNILKFPNKPTEKEVIECLK
jgi:cytochrome oxidase Cu insertion factor (SCO1/SenC/PrrC family)